MIIDKIIIKTTC